MQQVLTVEITDPQRKRLDSPSALGGSEPQPRLFAAPPSLPEGAGGCASHRAHPLPASSYVCEEIVFRGYLIWYFSQFAPSHWAVLLSSLAFGLAHSYQGLWANVLTTGSVGLVAALLYVFSGSLWLAMAFHVYLDLNQGRMMSAAAERVGEAEPAGMAEAG